MKGSKEHGYVRRGLSGHGENTVGFGSAFDKADFTNTGPLKTQKSNSVSRPVYLSNAG